ncbi:hypothetical protein D3C75_1367290 [compost metagenome]
MLIPSIGLDNVIIHKKVVVTPINSASFINNAAIGFLANMNIIVKHNPIVIENPVVNLIVSFNLL